MTSTRPITIAGAVAATVTAAVAAWILAAQQTNGMDIGPETKLGSFGFFTRELVRAGALIVKVPASTQTAAPKTASSRWRLSARQSSSRS